MLKMRYFFEKAEKSPQRLGLRRQTPISFRQQEASPPDPRVVISTQFTCYFLALGSISLHR